jgi:hypothetical protein
MEGRQRRSFTDDYKRQAVDLVASSGRSIGSPRRRPRLSPNPTQFHPSPQNGIAQAKFLGHRPERHTAVMRRTHSILASRSAEYFSGMQSLILGNSATT